MSPYDIFALSKVVIIHHQIPRFEPFQSRPLFWFALRFAGDQWVRLVAAVVESESLAHVLPIRDGVRGEDFHVKGRQGGLFNQALDKLLDYM